MPRKMVRPRPEAGVEVSVGPRTYRVDKYAAELVVLRNGGHGVVAYAADLEWAYGQWILRPEFIQRKTKG